MPLGKKKNYVKVKGETRGEAKGRPALDGGKRDWWFQTPFSTAVHEKGAKEKKFDKIAR